ncbi:UDP-glucose dehydrogenase family protein [Streptacidiphilus jiangxiensis]|uniref:UDP-glucose 6-dehydrogenase n=1 Tax=Streptacidiphilus jiangxiensis TaxID=235985 RepID=A0A1H7V1E6_STRJI|nr:UDP-glucose/GDP-mannose dehydrogenase family protein [Streptacidiphilus jiangxiensis]SEM02966.1 UDPglucose 6-dehydrogenase [Streptacidiphilus jiangxiensis]
MRITVIGTGYLGATHAVCMAELGHQVLGVDVEPDKVAALQAGRVPFYEPGLAELLAKHVASGQLRFTTSYQEAARFGQVHFSCVGTPQQADSHKVDLRHVDAVIESLAPWLEGPALVVGKSTVPVGTAARLAARLAELAPAGSAARLAWNPEFLREGFAVEDSLRPDRLVLGIDRDAPRADQELAEQLLREVYAPLLDARTPLVVTDFATAELVKTAANAFLATKISFINAMAEICEASGADVTQLAASLAHDGRIGGRFLRAGVGFGGGCLPKDIRGFAARAEELGVGEALSFLRDVDAINLRRRERVVDLARELCGGDVAGRRVAVWGAAFKPDSDDIRDSPALDVAMRLHRLGAEVTVFDPKAADNARKLRPELGYALDPVDAARDAEVVLHLTEWQEFRALDPRQVGAVAARPQIVDGRPDRPGAGLDADTWRAAGWTYRALGRP